MTDTEIWEQDWYLDLPNKYKLSWNYIKDKCDKVGVWRPNKSLLQKIIGEPINLDEFLRFVNIDKQRIIVLPSDRWWIKNFFIFQYGDKFSPNSMVHKGALKALVQNGIHINELFNTGIGNLQDIDFQELKEIAYSKTIDRLLIAYGKPIDRVIDKDKDVVIINTVKSKKEEEEKNKEKKEEITELKIQKNGTNFNSINAENFFNMVVTELNKIWLKKNNGYPAMREVDFPALLSIAYLIGERKGISKTDVVGRKESEITEAFEKIVSFLQTTEDKFFKRLTLDGIAIPKNFQKIEEAMRQKQNGGQKPLKIVL